MPVTPRYPGVYIEEVPSGVRTITGVATSITAFLGYFSRGPLGEARRIFSQADFEREFGGLRRDSETAYAIGQFYANGGSQAWVVRTADTTTAPVAAAVVMQDQAAAVSLTLAAFSPGVWGDNVIMDVDHGTSDPTSTFNLTVREVVNGQTVTEESFRNLAMADNVSNDAQAVVEGGSRLVSISAKGSTRPAPTGTVSGALTSTELAGLDDTATLTATIIIPSAGTSSGPHAVAALGSVPTSMAQLASRLQTIIRNAHADLARVNVTVTGSLASGAFVHVKAGVDDPSATVVLTDTGTGLGFATANVQAYQLSGASVGFQVGADAGAALPGADGGLPGADELIDALAALDKVDLINILSIPDTTRLDDAGAAAVATAATGYAEKRRSFYILDVPHPSSDPVDTVEEVEGWIDANSTLRHANVATYFPRPRVADPENDFRLRSVAPSGTMAGLYSRIDSSRGVWKAPAGTEADLRGVQALEYRLTDDENGVLNPIAINCLRNFRIPGNICWGARTLVGADLLASEWKYIPVRRLALFMEESLYRGSQWVVFEPNDEPLWAQIRLNVGAFMHSLFRQGAFQGTKPRDAYMVKCDKETTTQDDINRGIVNIVVGFAPLKPAEFVIIKITQLAGQVQT